MGGPRICNSSRIRTPLLARVGHANVRDVLPASPHTRLPAGWWSGIVNAQKESPAQVSAVLCISPCYIVSWIPHRGLLIRSVRTSSSEDRGRSVLGGPGRGGRFRISILRSPIRSDPGSSTCGLSGPGRDRRLRYLDVVPIRSPLSVRNLLPSPPGAKARRPCGRP